MVTAISKIIAEELPQIPFGFCSVKDIEKPNATRLNKNGLNTAIMFAFPYKVKENPPKNLSRYAAVSDYHEIIIPVLKELALKLRTLYPDFSFSAFADYSPILEVPAASLAGLGVVGKNGLLITKEYGSFVFLGEILCDIPYENTNKKIADCMDCGRCLSACPVSLKKDECLSALTQKKGELSPLEAKKIKLTASCFGCDICQNACPMNREAQNTEIAEFLQSYRDEFVLGEDTKNRAYTWRGEGVIARNYNILKEK